MAFEIKHRDLLARIGRLETKSGRVETPLFFPVVNPSVQPVTPKEMYERFGCEALMTNAYTLKKDFEFQPAEEGLHHFLDFDGIIMSDSGAYQILVYGDVEINPQEIVEYQEQIDTDIATILDHPTGWGVTREYAEKTVDTTVNRAQELFKTKTREDILWVGPVQGGSYLDLVARSSREMGKLPFHIHGLGSPTEIMQQYRFDILVDMIMTAKTHLPIQRPLHLFGAGHPFMFSLAVALGCDFFDSAAYALYAREDRYMTEYGTHRLEQLEYFPCPCPRCTETIPQEVREMAKMERETFLAEHNLYTCQAEMRRIKQVIRQGRLWEHLQHRAHVHPALLQALKKLGKYEEYIEEHSPATKRRGIFFFNHTDLARPEVVRYRRRLKERYTPPKEAEVLLLMPHTKTKPFSKSRRFREIMESLQTLPREHLEEVHVCFYAAPFGVIPLELDEVYPLCQHEILFPLDNETMQYVVERVQDYIRNTDYHTVILLHDSQNWNKDILKATRQTCMRKNITFKYLTVEEKWSRKVSTSLHRIVRQTLSCKP